MTTASGFALAVLRTVTLEATVVVVVGPTLVGCPTNELPNFPLFKALFLGLFEYEPVLQKTVDSLQLPYNTSVLLSRVSSDQDALGRIVVTVTDTDQIVADRIVSKLVSNVVLEFNQIEQLSGPLKRICNRIGAKYSPQPNPYQTTREMTIAFTTLTSFFAGFLMSLSLAALIPRSSSS
ncbi:MAG: hypothetical protein R3E39_14840 [Anaerolineae bacterium]